MEKKTIQTLIAVTVFLVILFAFFIQQDTQKRKGRFNSCSSCSDSNDSETLTSLPLPVRQGEWVGGRGPYNLQLYDASHYYPYYESRDYMAAWDGAGRCAAYCRASGDGGCAVVCR